MMLARARSMVRLLARSSSPHKRRLEVLRSAARSGWIRGIIDQPWRTPGQNVLSPIVRGTKSCWAICPGRKPPSVRGFLRVGSPWSMPAITGALGSAELGCHHPAGRRLRVSQILLRSWGCQQQESCPHSYCLLSRSTRLPNAKPKTIPSNWIRRAADGRGPVVRLLLTTSAAHTACVDLLVSTSRAVNVNPSSLPVLSPSTNGVATTEPSLFSR